MKLIQYIADILAWHKILFTVFSEGLSREVASQTSNLQVIEMLPASEQESARFIFQSFCEGFNAGVPLIENLYECQENPFVGKGLTSLVYDVK